MDSSAIDREQIFAREQRALRDHQQRVRDAENERLRVAREKALQAEEAARTKARQAVAEEQLKAHLKLAFLKQPAATEEDFVKQYPKLREDHLHRETISGPEREKAALAASGGYGM